MIALIRLLVTIGLQSLIAHKTKSLIVGGLMMFGAFLVVVSLALVGSVEQATRKSIVQSVSGDLQVYDKNAKDKLALLGSIGFGTEDIGQIKSFDALDQALKGADNVKAVVPMGIANANVSAPGDLDRALNDLRDAVRSGDKATAQALAERVRSIAQVLSAQQEKSAAIENGAVSDAREILARATSDALWQEFAADPLPVLDWLDVKLAPLGEQGSQFFLRLVGSDVETFTNAFPRIRVVEGQMIPKGTRGVLVGRSFLDKRVKMNVAMNLDTVAQERAKGGTIAASQVLREVLARTQRQSSRLLYLLAPRDVPTVQTELRKLMPESKATDLAGLLADFLVLNDDNFDVRYKAFYDIIGSRIQLYPFKVGDTITMTSFSKSGYIRSVNVKVWGIYAIDGLESSLIAGALSITDLLTFRELYGERTAALDKELLEMKAQAQVKTVDRAEAEAALFGDDSAAIADVTQQSGQGATKDVEDSLKGIASSVKDRTDTFDPVEAKRGLALSAAVLLNDETKGKETRAALQAKLEPLGLQVVEWQEATGFIGQMTLVVRGVLLTAITILFIVIIVILNNSMVMATLERVAEFGTLRAIGAQRGFINAMVTFETAVLGTIAGGLGALGGMACVTWLGHKGIPAPADLIMALFGGPRLYPVFTAGDVIAGLVATLVVSVFATLYPARLATRVQPVVAMQGKE